MYHSAGGTLMGEAFHVCVSGLGGGRYGNSLYLPLSFSVNIQLLKK